MAAGFASSDSTAGARRRYQRIVPSVMARTAARWSDASNAPSATSAECPPESTASSACAAPASADAPGAQGDLAKTTSSQSQTVGKIPHRNGAASRPLDLRNGERAGTTGDTHKIVLNSDDRPRIGTFRGIYCAMWRRFGSCGENPQLFPLEQGLGDRPGVERPHLPFDALGVVAPVDAALRLVDLGCIRRALQRLRHPMQRAFLKSVQRVQKRRRAERGQLVVQKAAGVLTRNGTAALQEPRSEEHAAE